MKRVLILDGAIYRDIYRPADHWRALLGDVPADSVHLPSGEPVPELRPYSHLIVSGSEASIVRPEPWYHVEADAVRRAAAAGLAILGSCFGHQMLARALSGERYVAAAPQPEVGWIEVEVLAPDPLFADVASRHWVFASHFDEVRDPPPPWRVLARSPGCAVHAMRYGNDPIWGIQAHPEITPSDARVLIEGFLLHEPHLAPVMRPALAAEPHDDGTALPIVRRFLEA
ncbi:MAG: gamma-glutamyl-gamma-aminobutyrate hydrolase family protein [Deltaproteobacteria bacterium]|nr:gamma-glutamyl-gamma-aminobutyrate hydrolase family protein [Deltaproteobacteria bacterium]